MSLYGDMGNIIALKYFYREIDIEVIYQPVEIAAELPEHTDIYFMGGGQDKEQEKVASDLMGKKASILDDLENDRPLLTICGGYQLFGERFLTGNGVELEGLGWFPVVTKAMDAQIQSRCIGNIVEDCQIAGLEGVRLVGFENHGGQTYFTDPTPYPLGKVVRGFGNNFEEKIEGCVKKNTIGTYMHGSFLPKNPEITKWLIQKTLEHKLGGEVLSQCLSKLDKLDIEISMQAKHALIKRFLEK